jgi:hypothetical protein
MISRLCAAVFAIMALSACSGAGSTTTATPAGAKPCNITGIVDPNARLVSPAPGATGVSISVGSLSFTVSNAALRTGTVTLWISVGSGSAPAVEAGPIATDANGVSSASLPVLQPHTTYEARIHVVERDSAGNCVGVVDGDLGPFTTQ